MQPHPAFSHALSTELERERTRTVRRPSPRRPSSFLRAVRSRRTARAVVAGCCA